METSEPDAPDAAIFVTKASPTPSWPLPPKADWAGFINGKSVDTVDPVTKIPPATGSIATPVPKSALVPPMKVEKRNAEPSAFTVVTKASVLPA